MPRIQTASTSGQLRLGHAHSVIGPTAEAQLLPPAVARSGSRLCADGLNPVFFHIERIEDEAKEGE